MFCKHCGKEIADDAVICVGCGRMVDEIKKIKPMATKSLSPSTKFVKLEKLLLTIAVLAFVASIISTMASFLLGFVNVDIKTNKDNSMIWAWGHLNFEFSCLIVAICLSSISIIMSSVSISFSEINRRSGEKHYLTWSISLLVFSAIFLVFVILGTIFNSVT